MPRFEIAGDPISVAYGYDEVLSNVFLSVYDRRLEFDSDAPDQVNAVTEGIGPGDGGGCYFNLHTGKVGFGRMVDDETMAVYLRFGVSDASIRAIPLLNVHRSTGPAATRSVATSCTACTVCRKPSTTSCGKCHSVPYCSKDCQRSDWAVHKIFCSHVFPPLVEGELSAKAFLLPQSSITPILVQLSYTIETDASDGNRFAYPVLAGHIPGPRRNIRSDRLPGFPFAHLPHALIMYYDDNFFIDGVSQPNQCLMRLMRAKRPHWSNPFGWSGNLVIIKAEADVQDPISFMDMACGDAHDLVEFIAKYETSSGRDR